MSLVPIQVISRYGIICSVSFRFYNAPTRATETVGIGKVGCRDPISPGSIETIAPVAIFRAAASGTL